MWGVQFHPEVYHTETERRFSATLWSMSAVASKTGRPPRLSRRPVARLKEQLATTRSCSDFRAGVDSSVAAVLLNKAIGKNLTCIFVDHGLLRKNEFENVMHDYEHLGLNVIGVNAKDKFYRELAGVKEPERKRKNHRQGLYRRL